MGGEKSHLPLNSFIFYLNSINMKQGNPLSKEVAT